MKTEVVNTIEKTTISTTQLTGAQIGFLNNLLEEASTDSVGKFITYAQDKKNWCEENEYPNWKKDGYGWYSLEKWWVFFNGLDRDSLIEYEPPLFDETFGGSFETLTEFLNQNTYRKVRVRMEWYKKYALETDISLDEYDLEDIQTWNADELEDAGGWEEETYDERDEVEPSVSDPYLAIKI
jgi:hypothetical protein